MAKVVKPLDIDAVLGKAKNRVSMVGVELEGGWTELPPGVPALEPDGSVFHRKAPTGAKHIGELPIGPALPAAIGLLMAKNYPHKINATCGLHVHVSFESLFYYALLMVPEYQETVCEYLTRWAKENKLKETHAIWARLRGESEFCRKEFWPDLQASTKRKNFDHAAHGHRYTVIHYCGRYNTIECRVLPMMNTPQLAISAVQRFIEITNACLYVLGKDVKKVGKSIVHAKLELPAGLAYEESIEVKI